MTPKKITAAYNANRKRNKAKENQESISMSSVCLTATRPSKMVSGTMDIKIAKQAIEKGNRVIYYDLGE